MGRSKDSIFYIIVMMCVAITCTYHNYSFAQSTIHFPRYIQVIDSLNGSPIQYANVFFNDLKKGYLTDESGLIYLPSGGGKELTVSSVGYETLKISLPQISKDTLLITIAESPYQLDELVVGKRKQKYSKKNNPAVDLVQRVRKDYNELDPKLMPSYSYETYEKTILGGNNIGEGSLDNKSRYLKLEQFVDTAPWTGKRILDLALFEKVSLRKEGKKNKADKEIVLGLNSHGIHEMLPFDNIRDMISDVVREINIYDNDISLLQNRFVSPLSKIGPDFYKYFLTDTLWVNGENCIEVSFSPRTPETFGFNGKLFIPLEDSLKYVKRISMRVPKAINLNYIDNIFVSQNYFRDSIGKVHKTLDDVAVEIRILKLSPPLFANRQTRYHGFSYEETDSINIIYEDKNREKKENKTFWDEKRILNFSKAEKNLSNLPALLRKNKFIYWGEKIFKPVFEGYVGTMPENSKFNIGPVNTFISFNDVEGLRLKLGGMSTSSLSRHVFFRGYGAYGFKDHKWKYLAEAEYSFFRKEKHSREFPMNGIRLTYSYDIDQIGVRYLYSNPDNIILSIKRIKNDLVVYKHLTQLEYNLELSNNLSFNVGLRHIEDDATEWVNFENGFGETFKKMKSASFFATVRYAPGEKFVQGTTNRRPINMDAPILTISHEYGPKKFLGSQFTLNKTEISALKRFWFSAFGYANVLLKGGKLWSSVPFPFLLWQNANLSYTIQQETYALMNPMEFALDEFASWDIEYFINGAIFNRIPLLKKTKLREIVSFKGVWGGLTKKNNPAYNKSLFSFPPGSGCYVMGSKPYMEIGVGIDNIFTILRVDYVWRLTYRNNPGIDKSGLRVSLHLSF